jgi:hypothetical protein
MTITVEGATKLAIVCAQLAREGVTFDAVEVLEGTWVITLRGGF